MMADAGSQDPGRVRRAAAARPAVRAPGAAPESAAALTLRLVMGVATEDIARLFLVPTATMAARLTRARKRLAGESFDLPAGTDLDDRLALAADVAYLAFTAGYAPGSGADVLRPAEAAEAIRLARRAARRGASRRTGRARRAAGPDAAAALAPRRTRRRRRWPGAAARPGPQPLARRGDRRGPRPPDAVGARAGDAVPAAGADRGRARGRAERRRAPTGRGSRGTTASWRSSPAPPSSGSTERSPSPRPTARRPGWRCWTAWSWRAPPARGPRPAAAPPRPGRGGARRAGPRARRCAATRPSAPASGGCCLAVSEGRSRPD